MPEFLIQAISAKERGDTSLAKQLLSQAIIQNPRDEAAWMLLAEMMDNVKMRRECLEKVLAINPDNTAASMELSKLNTTPLEQAMRGERSKPADRPQEPADAAKTPPFTPPFTWDSKPEQYLALGDHTFPDLNEEEENQIAETPPTFDWANETEEPDKTIDKIFEAVSKPELASEPPQKESDWLNGLRPEEDILEPGAEIKKPVAKQSEPMKAEDPWLQELLGSEDESPQEERTLTPDDFSVSAEPELGLEAFATSEEPSTSFDETDSLLWDNPQARTDRLVILSYRSLIYAHPAEADIPEIMNMFNENRMVRSMLGENAHMIKLENIERVTANPKDANMVVEYKPNGKVTTHQLSFASIEVRDEVLRALKFRLGAGFIESSRTTSMEDKILAPIFLIVLIAVLAWVLIGGVPLLSQAQGLNTGTAQVFLSNVQQFINQIGTLYIIIAAVLISAACVVWLVLNLRKPSSEVVLRR